MPAPKGNRHAAKEQPKSKNIHIRVAAITHEALSDAAQKSGLSLTDFILSACLEKIARQ